VEKVKQFIGFEPRECRVVTDKEVVEVKDSVTSGNTSGQ